MLWFGRKREPQEPLPPVIAPEVVGNGQGRYLDRVLDESRRVLDAPLSSFRELESFSSSRDGTSWSVHTRPVEGTKVGAELKQHSRASRCTGRSTTGTQQAFNQHATSTCSRARAHPRASPAHSLRHTRS